MWPMSPQHEPISNDIRQRSQAVELGGVRTAVSVPMVKDNELVGIIAIYRQEVRPFTDKQIELVTTSPPRPSSPSRTRGCSTNCANRWSSRRRPPRCCNVIASSPGELEPVFDAMLENAVRICDAGFGTLFRFDGKLFHSVASFGTPSGTCRISKAPWPIFSRRWRQPDHRSYVSTKVSCPRRSMRSKAISSGPAARFGGARTMVAVPMLKDDEIVGAYRSSTARRSAPSPTSRSSWCRTSPPRPSSPSRTRGCSTNCASARTISLSRWSSRPRPPRC